MLRLLRKIVLLSSFFAIYTFANDAMISQMSSAFFSSFFSFFPIVALGAILSVGLSLAQKRPEFLAYGCGGIFLSVFIVGLILAIIEFVKAYSIFFYYRRHSSNTSYHSCSDRFQRNPN